MDGADSVEAPEAEVEDVVEPTAESPPIDMEPAGESTRGELLPSLMMCASEPGPCHAVGAVCYARCIQGWFEGCIGRDRARS